MCLRLDQVLINSFQIIPENSNKVLNDLAAKGQCNNGWFFGLMLLSEKILLRKRAMIESVCDELKNIG